MRPKGLIQDKKNTKGTTRIQASDKAQLITHKKQPIAEVRKVLGQKDSTLLIFSILFYILRSLL